MHKYKIRAYAEDGTVLWSGGGMDPKWHERGGKVWSTLGALRNHLNQFTGAYGRQFAPDDIDDWEVVTFELKELQAQPVAELLKESADKKAAKAAKETARREEALRQRELAELKRLTERYGPP